MVRHTVGNFPTIEHVQGTPPSIHTRQEFWACSKLWPCVDGRRQTVRARYKDGEPVTRPLPARSRGGSGRRPFQWWFANVCMPPGIHISEWQYIFRSGNTYFGVAIHISEWQYIFRSGNTYFGVAIHISERHYIFRNGNTYFIAAIHISEWHYIFQSGIIYFSAALNISEEAVGTRWGHGENSKLLLYEDGELGTRPGRTRYWLVELYGPSDKWENNLAGENFGWFFTVLDSVFF